jgi:hypothetical protein
MHLGHRSISLSLLSSILLSLGGCGACVAPPTTDDAGVDAGNANLGDGGSVIGARPTVTITAPTDGALFGVGETVTFEGTATDAEDVALSGTAIAWVSDLEGDLGVGETVQTALTMLGTHTITMAAEDSDAQIGTATVTIEVVDNLPPIVTISSPDDSDSYSLGESVDFNCSAVDPEGLIVANGDIVWSSDLQGALGIGANVVNALSVVGTHLITCAAVDADGALGSATVSVTVVDNFAPEVEITNPDDGSYFLTGTTVPFNGVATDAEDGALTGLSLQWFAGTQQIGSGASIQTTLADGTHLITLEATDTEGAKGYAQITVHFVDNLPPVCTIQEPNDGADVPAGSSVQFDASCTDPDGTGAIANVDITWVSDLDGPLGTGASVQNALVTEGVHIISVCAVDTEDATVIGCETVTVVVFVNEPPSVTLTSPASGTVFAACVDIDLSCDATDPEGDAITYQWSSSVDGAIGGGKNRTWTPDTSGPHTITCTATDALGALSSSSVTLTILSPAVAVTTPADGDAVGLGETITFRADACDTEDGDLNGASVVWSSNVAGQLGVGRNLDVNGLAAGAHTVTVTGTDANGNTSTDTVAIVVDERPVVTITAPSDGASFPLAGTTSVGLAATATDVEDGTLIPSFLVAPVGTTLVGASVDFTDLVPGFLDVIASATDSVGLIGTDQIRISIVGDDPLVSTVLANGNVGGATAVGGSIFVASSLGLVELDANSLTPTTTWTTANSDLPRTNTLSVAVGPDGDVFVGQQEGLAARCDPTDITCDPTFNDGDQLNLDAFIVNAIAVLPDGRVLVGTDQCMLLATPDFDVMRRFCEGDGGGDGLIGDQINDFAVDEATGDVWIATDKGASLMSPADINQTQNENASTFVDFGTDEGLADEDVRGIAIAPSGDVWFATAGGVTVRADGGTPVTSFDQGDGLSSDDTYDVAIDVVSLAGSLREVAWVASSSGLNRIDAEHPPIQVITTADGLVSNACRSVTVLSGHEKLVGTTSGMSVYRGY